MRGRYVALVAAALIAVVPLRAAEPRWTRVQAPHFTVSGDAPADDVRRTALLLEMFRDVFLRVLPGARDQSLLPPFVVVFGTEEAFAPFKPAYGGRPAPVGGYSVREPLAPCMALRLDRSGESFRTIFHEYVHVLFSPPRAPLWLTEGVADYYSTATINADRGRVLVGVPVRSYVAWLSRRWVPLAQILAVSRSDRIWEGDLGPAFYSESWALVHYLVRGTRGGAARLSDFVERLQLGENESSAFERAIGQPSQIDAEIRRYVRSGLAPAAETRLPEQVSLKSAREHTMSAVEVDATLGRLLFQLGRDDEALSRLNAAIRLDPGMLEANTALGILHLRAGRVEEAIGPLRRAIAKAPDNSLVAYDYALASVQACDAGLIAPLEEAHDALARLVTSDSSAEPVAVLGTAAGRLGRLEESEQLLRRATRLAPARFSTQLELADVCLRVGEFDEGREILAAIRTRAQGAQLDAVAQRAHWLAMAEVRAGLRAELAAAAGLQASGPDPGLRRTGIFPKPPSLRNLLPGEQRVAGLLDSIDCSTTGIVVRMTTKAGPLAVKARTLSGVHLASARDDAGGVMGCGARERREAVYVTWSGDRQLVAIEFLPAEFQPRQ
jgi:Flp pilus assembly protein TadD